MTRDEALSAMNNGATAAFISGGLTAALFAYAMIANEQGDSPLGLLNDPTNFLDIILTVGCAIGLRRRSRAAAVTMVIYWVIAKAAISVELGRVGGAGVSLIFLYYFVQAARGAFTYHKIERVENPNYRRTSKWWGIVGIPIGILMAAFAVLGILQSSSVLPSMTLIEGGDLSSEDERVLRSSGVLQDGEHVELFYSHGLMSILDGGVVATDSRVVGYSRDVKNMEEIEIYSLPYESIGSLTLVEAGNTLNDSVYRVSSFDEDVWFEILLPVEDQGDTRFAEVVRAKIAR